jgi:Flp pilus assembly protein TadG
MRMGRRMKPVPADAKVALVARSGHMHIRHGERGASLVEYAFILIFFLTLILGISGFGHALYVYHHLNNAAKEATRYAAVRGATCSSDNSCIASNSASGITGPTTMADVEAYVASLTPPSIDSSKFTYNICGVSDTTTTVSDSGGICAASPTICSTAVSGVGPEARGYPGCTVRVQIALPYSFIFPLLPSITTTTAPCKTAGLCMSSESEMIIVH